MVRRRGDERGLVTLLFTDIVGSSDVASELGDERWHRLQARHHAAVRKQLKLHGGHEVDTAGDGFFATFSSPARGVRCAFAIVREVRQLGLDVRAGLHIGEAQLTGEKVGGIAVATAARVSAAAGPGQVLATDTIVHMVAGSGFGFTDLGSRELKGVQGRWELSSLDAVDAESIGPPLDPPAAVELRERASPPDLQRGRPRAAMVLGIAGILVAASAGAILLFRDRPGTNPLPSPGPVPKILAAFDDGTGAPAFPIDLPFVGSNYPALEHVGPILFTGRSGTPAAFTWVPEGGMVGLQVPQINRGTGAVIEPVNMHLFRTGPYRTLGANCTCVASAKDRIWTPVATASSVGLMLRGIGLKGQPKPTDILVDRALPSQAVATFVSGGGYLWVGDSVSDQVYRVDPMHTGSPVPRFRLHLTPDLMTFADGSLWVLDKLQGKLVSVDPSSGEVTAHILISGDLHGMAIGGGFVWVTDGSGNRIWRIAEDMASPATEIPVGQIDASPNGVAYDDGAIVVGFANGTVAKINPDDPTTPGVLWTQGVGNNAESIAIDNRVVWIAGGPTSLL